MDGGCSFVVNPTLMADILDPNAGISRNIEFRQGNSTQGGFTALTDFFVGASSTDNVFYVDRSEEKEKSYRGGEAWSPSSKIFCY